MTHSGIIIAGMISVAVILAAVILVFGRLKLEQQRTIQKLLEKDEASRPEWAPVLGSMNRGDNDFRRGVLLLVMGLTIGVFLFFVGGKAWILGSLPVTLGLVYLFFFWTRNATQP